MSIAEMIREVLRNQNGRNRRSRLGHSVDHIDADGIIVAGERIVSKTVIWTAGVAPSPAGKRLKVETDRAGRVRIQKDLTVPEHPEICVIGDIAWLEQNGKALPGVAQVAMQQGRYAAKLIRSRIAWAAVHLQYLGQSSLRVSVFLQWIWTHLTGQRGSRLIVIPRVSESSRTAVETRSTAVSGK